MSHVGGVGDNHSNIKLAVMNLILHRQDEDSGNRPVGKQILAFFGDPVLLPRT